MEESYCIQLFFDILTRRNVVFFVLSKKNRGWNAFYDKTFVL